MSADPTITPELIEEHGITSEEYERIQGLLGREPNYTELGIFSVMWSEHCSYKNTRSLLKGFPTKSPRYIGETDPENFDAYGVGYVELPGEVKVEARLTENDPTRLRVGMEMELTVVPLAIDEEGNEVVTFAFQPTENN